MFSKNGLPPLGLEYQLALAPFGMVTLKVGNVSPEQTHTVSPRTETGCASIGQGHGAGEGTFRFRLQLLAVFNPKMFKSWPTGMFET